jgi:hypothetical protein
MKIEVKAAPKKFEPKTIEITVESFEELKNLRKSLKREGYPSVYGASTPVGVLFTTVSNLYKQALDNGEVDYDF